jgi:hypothetical protein
MNPLVSKAAALLGSISNDRSAKCNASSFLSLLANIHALLIHAPAAFWIYLYSFIIAWYIFLV